MKENKHSFKKWTYWFLFAVAVITVYKTLDNFTAIGEFLKKLFGKYCQVYHFVVILIHNNILGEFHNGQQH